MNTIDNAEAEYRSFIQNSSDPVFSFNRDGTYKYVNEAFAKPFGKTPEEIVGKNPHYIFSEEEAEKRLTAVRKVFQTGQKGELEVKVVSYSGDTLYFLTLLDPVKNAEGEVMHVSCISKDITERKKADDALKASNDLFTLFMRHSPIYTYIKEITPTGSIVLQSSENFKDMIGISRQDMIGKTMTELFPPEFAAKITEDDLAVTAKGEVIRVEEELNGRSYTSIKFPISLGNKKILGGYTIDVTEQRRAEQSLRFSQAMLARTESIAHIGSWTWDVATDTTTWSDEMYRIFRLDPAQGAPPFSKHPELYHHEDMVCLARAVEAALRERTPYELELRAFRSDGQTRICLARGFAEAGPDGKVVRLFGSLQDITEQKTTEQLLRDAQRRESVGILSGAIAHDFNNLLGTMMGNVSLALSQLPDTHLAANNIRKALTAMDRAAELTKQMLAYAGKGKYQNSTIDLGTLVLENVNLFDVSLPKNVKLMTTVPSTPVYVNGDPSQIEQIIINFIINAGEAIGDRQGVVSFTLTEAFFGHDELVNYGKLTNTRFLEGRYALIEVKDNGTGMSDETMRMIFDPFFTTKFTGRGLGLAAVLGIVQGHKGGITVESSVGSGTTFRVILPVGAAPEAEKELPQENTNATHTVTTTILVIDDEEDVATMAQEVLESNDYTTLVKLNPVEGIGLYEQERSTIGLVLLDLTMPEMSGKEVVDALQAINPDVKIIISSGYSEEEVARKMGGTKVSAYIQKPYRVQSLLTMVDNVLKGR